MRDTEEKWRRDLLINYAALDDGDDMSQLEKWKGVVKMMKEGTRDVLKSESPHPVVAFVATRMPARVPNMLIGDLRQCLCLGVWSPVHVRAEMPAFFASLRTVLEEHDALGCALVMPVAQQIAPDAHRLAMLLTIEHRALERRVQLIAHAVDYVDEIGRKQRHFSHFTAKPAEIVVGERMPRSLLSLPRGVVLS